MISPDRAHEILSAAKDAIVLSYGDAMLDAYLTGSVSRFSQEAPVPVIPVSEEKFYPGGAGNAAACMAHAGLACYLVSVIGGREDVDYAALLSREQEKSGIHSRMIRDAGRRTTVKMRIAARKTTYQHVARVDIEDTHPLESDVERQVIAAIDALVFEAQPAMLSIHDYRKGCLTEGVFRHLTAISNERRVPIFADLKEEHFVQYRSFITAPDIFFLKLNSDESRRTVALLSRFDTHNNTDEEIVEVARIIQREVPITLIITRGEKGAVLFERAQEPYFVRPREVTEQFDVAGAGDTVSAFCIASHVGGASLHEALDIATEASQVAIRKFGTSVVSVPELLSWIRHESLAREQGGGVKEQ